jgi:hypothetical protein
MVQHVGVRQHYRSSPPAFRNGASRAVSQGDQGIGRLDENVLLLVVRDGFAVMRVAKVVHRIDQRLAVSVQLIHHVSQAIRCDGVEPEMYMKYVELIVIVGDPAWFEHHWRPPATRNLSPIGWHRIRQPTDSVATSRLAKMADVNVRRRYRSYAQRMNSSSVDDRGASPHA